MSRETPKLEITEARPVHDEREIEAVLDVLKNGTVADLGPRVAGFERRIALRLAKRHRGVASVIIFLVRSRSRSRSRSRQRPPRSGWLLEGST